MHNKREKNQNTKKTKIFTNFNSFILHGKVIPNKVEHAPPKNEKTESIFGRKIPIAQGPNKNMAVTRTCVFLSKGALFPLITFTN